MANRLSPALVDVIGACYEEGLKTMEIQDFLNGERQFGLNLTYQKIRNHNPAVVAQRKEYYGMPDVKAHMKDIHRGNHLRRQAERIAVMADNVEHNLANPKVPYIFSTKEGEVTRKRILDYLEGQPGARYNSIGRALDLESGTVAYHLRRLENEDLVFSEKSVQNARYYPLHRTVHRVYHAICETPCLTQTELAKRLGIKQAEARYHAEKFVKGGKVLREIANGEVRYREAREMQLPPPVVQPKEKMREVTFEWVDPQA